jgi:hypothetical protein
MITSEEAVDTLRATVVRLGPYRIHASYTCVKEYKEHYVPDIKEEYKTFKLDPLYEQSNGTGTIYKYTRK